MGYKDVNVETRNKIKETMQANKLARKDLDLKIRIVKLDTNKSIEKTLNRWMVEAKWLYNYSLSQEDPFKIDIKIKEIEKMNHDKTFSKVELRLPSQIKQKVLKSIQVDITNLSKAKKKGLKVGKIKFKKRCNSIDLDTCGIYHYFKDGKVKLPKIKKHVKVFGLERIPKEAIFANAKLVKKPSGFYIHQTLYLPKMEDLAQLDACGIDMGIRNTITLDDGKTFDCRIGETRRLKGLSKKIARQQKGSNNFYKTKAKLAREHEYLANKRKDKANEIVSYITKTYKTICLQDENLNGWHSSWFGKQVQHSCLGTVKEKLKRLPKTKMVGRWEPTTQLCPNCLSKNKIGLEELTYSCSCGYSSPRDKHSALVIKMMGLGQILTHVESSASTLHQVKQVDYYETCSPLVGSSNLTIPWECGEMANMGLEASGET